MSNFMEIIKEPEKPNLFSLQISVRSHNVLLKFILWLCDVVFPKKESLISMSDTFFVNHNFSFYIPIENLWGISFWQYMKRTAKFTALFKIYWLFSLLFLLYVHHYGWLQKWKWMEIVTGKITIYITRFIFDIYSFG